MSAESTSDAARRAQANDTLDRALALLLEHDMAGFAGLWAPTGTMEFPFAPAGYPKRVEGRAAVVEYLSGYTSMVDVRGIPFQTRHQTLDPDTVIVEFEVEGVALATGSPYRMRYISVITVQPDGISSYRDYWSPQAAAEAVGGTADQLHDAISGRSR